MKHSLLLLCLFATACQTPIGLDKDENTYSSIEGDFEINVSKHDIQLRNVDVRNVRSSRPFGLLRIELELVNGAKNRAAIEWRARWFDGSGNEVTSQSPWFQEILEAQDARNLTLTAPTPACKGWRLAVRTPHTSN